MKTIGLLLVVGVLAMGCAPKAPVAEVESGSLVRAHTWESLDLNIETYEQGVKADPGSALGWSLLSGAYLARSKERDSFDDAILAEKAARKSWSIRKPGNLAAGAKIVQSMLEQHRFKSALGTVLELQDFDPKYPAFKHLRADILIELGRYAEARGYMRDHAQDFADSSGKLVRARLYDVYGKPEEALRLTLSARDAAASNPELPGETVAWLHVKVGQQLLKLERTEEAQIEFERAIAIHPTNWKALLGLSRVAYLDKDWKGVIEWGERSEAVAPMADGVALMGDAYREMGNREQAEIHYQEVRALAGLGTTPSHGHSHGVKAHGHPMNRQFAMFCADHGKWLDEGLAAAREDVLERPDIYAYDSLAWSAFNAGRLVEAKEAMDKALATGSRDPVIHRHAKQIFARPPPVRRVE